jgi:hypothetical protein
MRCGRCAGLLVRTWLNEDGADLTAPLVEAWRCPVCGEITDDVIEANRVRPPVDNGRRKRRAS